VNCSQVCSCVNGICNGGIDGNGQCNSCRPTFWGSLCNNNCTCKTNDTCNDGIHGNGLCLACNIDGYFGPTCDIYCTCNNGVCQYAESTNNISCKCDPGFLLDKNNTFNCLPCPTSVACTYGQAWIEDSNINLNSSLNGDLYIVNSVIDITTINLNNVITDSTGLTILPGETLLVSGDFNSQFSYLLLNSNSTVYIKGNVGITNTTWSISSSSSINISGCINLQNGSITIKDEGNNDDKPILSFNATCSHFDLNAISIISDNNSCTTSTVVTETKNSVFMINIKTTTNPDCSGMPLWIIVLISGISAVVLGVIVLIAATSIKALKKEVFPFRQEVTEVL